MIIREIIFNYDNKNLNKKCLNNLQSLNFSAQKNRKEIAKFVLLIGKNGSNKTSLLILIARLFDNLVLAQNYNHLLIHDNKDFSGWPNVKMCLNDQSIYFYPRKLIGSLDSNQIFDYNAKNLHWRVFFENKKQSILPQYLYITPSAYGDDNKITQNWQELCTQEYKEGQMRKKYELQKNSYKDNSYSENKINDVDHLDTLGNLTIWLEKKGIHMSLDHYANIVNCSFNVGGNFREIKQLPSGIKHQIILRWVMSAHCEYIFLLDEPENSLYPCEQQDLINFYIKNSQDRLKKHQFFIATHSPFILKNFLNRNDVAIINMENGENIKISENKKLLLINNGNVSYDEINYLYFDIITPSYYLSLFEKLKTEICRTNKIEDDMKYTEIDDWLKNDAKNRTDICTIKCEKAEQTILVRLRHLLAHGIKNEKEYKYYQDQKNKGNEIFDEKTREFYKNLDDNFEGIIKKNIELIRTTILSLIN